MPGLDFLAKSCVVLEEWIMGRDWLFDESGADENGSGIFGINFSVRDKAGEEFKAAKHHLLVNEDARIGGTPMRSLMHEFANVRTEFDDPLRFYSSDCAGEEAGSFDNFTGDNPWWLP